MAVSVIGSESKKEHRLDFTSWAFAENKRKREEHHQVPPSFRYVLKKPWNDLRHENGFQIHQKIQLWSYRRNDHLCFAVVGLEIDEEAVRKEKERELKKEKKPEKDVDLELALGRSWKREKRPKKEKEPRKEKKLKTEKKQPAIPDLKLDLELSLGCSSKKEAKKEKQPEKEKQLRKEKKPKTEKKQHAIPDLKLDLELSLGCSWKKEPPEKEIEPKEENKQLSIHGNPDLQLGVGLDTEKTRRKRSDRAPV